MRSISQKNPKGVGHVLLVLLCIVPSFAFAQAPSFTGLLRDSLSHKPVAFATIALYRNNSSQSLQVIYSDGAGKYVISADTGSYILVCTSIGYIEKKAPVTIRNDEPANLPTILMAPMARSLDAVTVVAKKPLIEHQDDKIIFNTAADPSTKSETALDILRKTPFVSVDGNDNVLINGQSNFKVLLNGRETGMFSQNVSQALKSFPGASIARIEVITNPSAKYDAEGVGGVINIVTRQKIVGYSGIASLTMSSIYTGSGALNFNIKKGKVGIALNYNLTEIGLVGHQAPPLLVHSTTNAVNSQAYTSRVSAGSTIQTLFQHFGNAEIVYELDSFQTVSLFGSVFGGYNNLSTSTRIQTLFASTTNESFFTLQNRTENPGYNIGSDFVRKFKGIPEKEFSIKLFNEYTRNNSFLESYQDNAGIDRYTRNNNYANNTQTTLQTEYVIPMKKKQKLETGLKMILRDAVSDYKSLLKYTPTDVYNLVAGNSDNFVYKQQVYSAYGSYNFALKKWPLRIGLRMEHTEVNGSFNKATTVVRQRYTHWIPNIQASTQVTGDYRIVLSYGQRIQRPFINNLNPFVNNNDTLNVSYGNPQLTPQLTHMLSLQNSFSKGRLFAGLTLTGMYSNDRIIQISSFNSTTGVTSTTSENLGRELQLSLNGNITITWSKTLSMFINSNLQYTNLQNVSNAAQGNSGLSGSFGISNTIKVNTRFTVSTFSGIFKPPIGIQGYTSSQWFYNVTPSYKFFHDKLICSIAAARFFSKYVTVRTLQTDANFYSKNVNSFQARNFRIGATWNFGKLKEPVSRKKGVNNDDVL